MTAPAIASLEARYDVAVVGCGPVGAACANLLGKAGLSVLVLERAEAPHPLPRAVHIDHEMMRIFQSVGLADRLRPLMRETHGHVHIGADGGVIRYLGTVGQPKRFGWSNDYFFYQPELETELRNALTALPNVRLQLGAELVALEQDAAEARLAFLVGGQDEVARAAYVIGCDGASSSVRRLLGGKLDDLQFEEPWLVVDAEVGGPISFPDFAGLPQGADLQNLSVMVCDPRRPTTIVPGRGSHRRWEFMLLPGEDDRAMMQPDAVKALVDPWVQGSVSRIVRAATYRFHGLVAEQWRVGRVFLAGDAAHQTPPFFGQGMCHGLRDVANLAWKLPLVLQGLAGDTLLDTYQPERDPHVRAVIGAAVEAGRYICELDPERAAQRDQRLRAARMAGAGKTAADLIPPIRSGVVCGQEAAPAGERFIQPTVGWRGETMLLDQATGGGFVLIAADAAILAGLAPAEAAAWAAVGGHSFVLGASGLKDVDGRLSDWLQAHHCCAVLLRPDAYVFGVVDGQTSCTDLVRDLAERLVLQSPSVRVQVEEQRWRA